MVLTMPLDEFLYIEVDPAFPGAWRDEPYYSQLRKQAESYPVMIRIGLRSIGLSADGTTVEKTITQAQINTGEELGLKMLAEMPSSARRAVELIGGDMTYKMGGGPDAEDYKKTHALMRDALDWAMNAALPNVPNGRAIFEDAFSGKKNKDIVVQLELRAGVASLNVKSGDNIELIAAVVVPDQTD